MPSWLGFAAAAGQLICASRSHHHQLGMGLDEPEANPSSSGGLPGGKGGPRPPPAKAWANEAKIARSNQRLGRGRNLEKEAIGGGLLAHLTGHHAAAVCCTLPFCGPGRWQSDKSLKRGSRPK